MPSRTVVEGHVAVTAQVSLRHVTDDVPGISRIRRAKGSRYVDARGTPGRVLATLSRIGARYLATTQRRRHA